jgi:hypothetical protein
VGLPDEPPTVLPPAATSRFTLDLIAAVLLVVGWGGLTTLSFSFDVRLGGAWLCATLLVAGGVLGYDSERR